MADNSAKARATAYVDAEHARAHDAMKAAHQKWERHGLNEHMRHIGSIKENKAVIDARYLARMQTIENKKAEAARNIERRHNSLAGRLERLTPKGRARQAETWQRLEDRANTLQLRAGQRHQMQLERHYQHLQRERVIGNRNWVGMRGMHRDEQHDHKQAHIEHRPNKIHARMREMEQAKLAQLRPELKHEWQHQANRPPSNTIQHRR